MSKLMMCGVCCMLLSIWGIIQLFIMGYIYDARPVSLFEDVAKALEVKDKSILDMASMETFIQETWDAYGKISRNCYKACTWYIITLLLSILLILIAQKRAKKLERDLLNDEFNCQQGDIIVDIDVDEGDEQKPCFCCFIITL